MSAAGTAGQIVVLLIVGLICVGSTVEACVAWRAARIERQHEQALRMDREWDRARFADRQRRLRLSSAEPTENPTAERLRLMREAESLGFLDA